MNKIIFSEKVCRPENLYPFTLTRRIQDIRVGIITIREKWEKMLGMASFDEEDGDYRSRSKFDIASNIAEKLGCVLLIQSNVLPDADLIKAIKSLKNGESIKEKNSDDDIVIRLSKKQLDATHFQKPGNSILLKNPVKKLEYSWDIFQLNEWALQQDFILLTKGRKSAPLSKTNKLIKGHKIFIEKNAKVEHSFLNASTGPIYIGKNATIMEGCMIRGPFAISENACLKMGSKVYGATSIGPFCIAAGEIKNSILFGYSNKAHDGYLGDSVIGEWCNWGAGTTNSNLKNNASEIKIWTPNGLKNAGKKCGVLMGDYSRTAINTSINTGTVIGVAANVFCDGLTAKHIESFSWGCDNKKRYDFAKAMVDIANWKQFKNQTLSSDEIKVLNSIFEKLS